MSFEITYFLLIFLLPTHVSASTIPVKPYLPPHSSSKIKNVSREDGVLSPRGACTHTRASLQTLRPHAVPLATDGILCPLLSGCLGAPTRGVPAGAHPASICLVLVLSSPFGYIQRWQHSSLSIAAVVSMRVRTGCHPGAAGTALRRVTGWTATLSSLSSPPCPTAGRNLFECGAGHRLRLQGPCLFPRSLRTAPTKSGLPEREESQGLSLLFRFQVDLEMEWFVK